MASTQTPAPTQLDFNAVSSTFQKPNVFNEFSEADQETIFQNVEKRLSSITDARKYLSKQGFTENEIDETINYVQDAQDATPPMQDGENIVSIKDHEYRLGEVLGTGKYAEVRLAEKLSNGKKVALKILYTDCSNSKLKILRNQIRHEFQALKKIKHPNVVKLINYDIRTHVKMDNTERRCMIQVQELLSNGELFDYVECCGAFDGPTCRYVFRQFMQGLHACHEKGIAHRDLKPDNILLDADFNLKIVDFGFAKKFVSEEQRKYMATQLGTRGYMAPEIYEGKRYTEKCDIFSAGIILFILLAGYPPLQEAKPGDWWFQRLLEGRYSRFWVAHEQEGRTFTPEAKDLVIGMLEPRVEDRWDTTQILNCDWLQMPIATKQEYYTELSRRKNEINNKKQQLNHATRETTYASIDGLLSQAGGQPLKLQDLLETVRADFQKANNQTELLAVVENLAKSHQNVLDNLEFKIDDANEVGNALATASAPEDILRVVRLVDEEETDPELEKRKASQFLEILDTSILVEIIGEVAKAVSKEKEHFYNLQNVSLPIYNDSLYQLPLTSYRMSCGLDIFNCGLRLFIKYNNFHQTFYHGQMQIVPKEAKTMVKFSVKENYTIKGEDGEDDETFVKSYKMFIEIQCYQDPEQENIMIVGVRKKDQNFATSEAFSKFCDNLFFKTMLRNFVIAECSAAEEPVAEN